jgi:hypothetical protein
MKKSIYYEYTNIFYASINLYNLVNIQTTLQVDVFFKI